MDLLWVVVILAALGGAVYYFGNRRSAPRAAPDRLPAAAPPPEQEPPLQALQRAAAGDAVVFWDGSDAIVESVLACSETVNNRTTSWRWLVLDNGGLLELAPDGNTQYSETVVYHQGSPEFDLFTGEPEDGGLLKLFEERVRAGRSARAPVTFEYHENTWQLRSTGSFAVQPLGAPSRREVWRDISDDPGQNVYFEMTTANGGRALGIWTTHILIAVGRELADTDIRGVYRR